MRSPLSPSFSACGEFDGCAGDPITHNPRETEALHELKPLPGHPVDIHPSKLGAHPWVSFVNIETGVEMTSGGLRNLAVVLLAEADRVDLLNNAPATPARVHP